MNTPLPKQESAELASLYDVIISGAGPVGLFLACELALAHCSVLILEKAEDPHSPLKLLPFGIRGLSAPTIEALYRRGLLEELQLHKRLQNPHLVHSSGQGPKPHRHGGHFAGIPFYDDYVNTSQWKDRLSGSTPTNLLSEIGELESVLSRRAAALGVTVLRGLPVTGFHQSGEGVLVQAGDHSFTGKWLVGCDGSRSVVRKRGGFDFAGTEPEFTGYSARVEIADPEKLLPGRNLTPAGMYLQSQPGYILMLEFDGGEAHRAGASSLEQVQAVLRRVSNTDVTIKALHTATTWTDRTRQATRYRNGRVLLAGDAAHIHSPLGGQGLNLGIGDAMNLGWKLAATIQHRAPEGLLDSYQAERHPPGAQVLDWSRAQVAIMKPDPPARALHAIFRDLIHTRDGATYIAGRIWGVSTHYDLGGNHRLTGHSIPNFEWEDGVTMGELLRSGQGILLDFDQHAALQTWAREWSNQIRYVTGEVTDRLDVSAALIRPDGIIAWASGHDPDCSELQEAAARWFVGDAGEKS